MVNLVISLLVLACVCSLGHMNYVQAPENGLLYKLQSLKRTQIARDDEEGPVDEDRKQTVLRKCLTCLLDATGGEGDLDEVIESCAKHFVQNPDATCDEALNIEERKKRFFFIHFHFHFWGKKK